MVKSTAKKETEKKETKKVTYKVEVTRAKEIKAGSISFDLKVNDVMIYGMWYRAGISEKTNAEYEILAFPQNKGKDDKYYNIAWFHISDEVKAEIIKQLGELI